MAGFCISPLLSNPLPIALLWMIGLMPSYVYVIASILSIISRELVDCINPYLRGAILFWASFIPWVPKMQMRPIFEGKSPTKHPQMILYVRERMDNPVALTRSG
jgi:hypothetical protein